MVKEMDIRSGGNPHCPLCGHKYKNDEFNDADFTVDIGDDTLYGESWNCARCGKYVVIATEIDRIPPKKKPVVPPCVCGHPKSVHHHDYYHVGCSQFINTEKEMCHCPKYRARRGRGK